MSESWDPGAAQVIRMGKQGEKISYWADLEKIKSGEKPDIPVEEGDVIDVASFGPMLVTYAFYRFFNAVFRIGAGASVGVR